jgi:glycerophosphoryl diester phosphodiesterase
LKARNPENTMRAFTDAIRVGAHGLETDIHLSKDGVVVLSHVREIIPPGPEAYI